MGRGARAARAFCAGTLLVHGVGTQVTVALLAVQCQIHAAAGTEIHGRARNNGYHRVPQHMVEFAFNSFFARP